MTTVSAFTFSDSDSDDEVLRGEAARRVQQNQKNTDNSNPLDSFVFQKRSSPSPSPPPTRSATTTSKQPPAAKRNNLQLDSNNAGSSERQGNSGQVEQDRDVAPFYTKWDMFSSRWKQTLFGGFTFPDNDDGKPSPWLIGFQIAMMMLPWGSGLMISQFVHDRFVDLWLGAILDAVIVVVPLIIFQIIHITKYQPMAMRNQVEQLQVRAALSDQQLYDFEEKFFAPSSFAFLFGSEKTWTHLVLSSIMCMAMNASCIVLFSNYGANAEPIGTVVSLVFGWGAVAVCNFPLATKSPPESNMYNPTDKFGLKALSRSFYVTLFALLYVLIRSQEMLAASTVMVILIPVLFLIQLLPPVDALFFWATEQILVHGLGGSHAANDSRQVLMFLTASVGVVLTYFVFPVDASIALAGKLGGVSIALKWFEYP
eukprot:TRINITY_DN1180_c0_g2_i6.p1 TRINITY_DN1180_c0_g2~~TRINITY_DN1180_c0_g2_i6.p1  ORF type:complete len:426 (+),score=86.24 TRINITY_DN1180_c0_g2_i6:807-2084(+)